MKRLLILPVLATSFSASAQSLDAQALTEWLQQYEQAWESRDAQAVREIFTEDALYYETPYSEPFEGRDGIAEYWSRVTADQRDVEFDSDVIAGDGDVGLAHWTANFTSASTGDTVELDGVFVLEFDDQNLVSELREWWVLRP